MRRQLAAGTTECLGPQCLGTSLDRFDGFSHKAGAAPSQLSKLRVAGHGALSLRLDDGESQTVRTVFPPVVCDEYERVSRGKSRGEESPAFCGCLFSAPKSSKYKQGTPTQQDTQSQAVASQQRFVSETAKKDAVPHHESQDPGKAQAAKKTPKKNAGATDMLSALNDEWHARADVKERPVADT
eukprot:gene7544-693_t